MRLRLRSLRARIGAGAAALILAGVLFVWIAPYNIAASVPHLPGVSWLLHTYMRSAVGTWSFGVEPPEWFDPQDPALIRLGAGHFETGCAPCHGSPAQPRNPIVRGMRPEPPPLDEAAERYRPVELWWLVRHGLKYTAMPAWSGAYRDDEPWALAAFLLRYPELDARGYLHLAYGPLAPEAAGGARRFGFAQDRAAAEPGEPGCARCHGQEGTGRDGTAPTLSGQTEAFLASTLAAYADGRRPSGIMQPIAAGLSHERIGALARRYAALPGLGDRPAAPGNDSLAAHGQDLASRGTGDVPSCLACHDHAQQPPPRPDMPRIAGQPRRFLVIWLRLWRERAFGGGEGAQLMHAAAQRLSDAQIEALAAYFAEAPAAR